MDRFILSFVVEKIASQLIDEAGSLSGVRDQIESIEGELRRMQCFLTDADSKQDGGDRVKNWVAEIRDVAYDTEDVIDTFILHTSQHRKNGVIMIFKRCAFILNEVVFRHKLNNQINGIKVKISQITDSRKTYGIENSTGRGEEITSIADERLQEKRRSTPQAGEGDVVGLVQDMKALQARMIHGDSRRSVISIIGMAGLGKTTLARKLFLCSDVGKHFEYCAWVYVSQDYRAKEILQDLGKKVMGLEKSEMEKMNKEELKETMSRFLEERRYIIVLDDIWKNEVWDDLKAAFPDRKNGSRILLTSRYKDVALHADPRSSPHELCLLSDDDSWELLSKKACVEWNAETSLPPWTEELGRQIVKRRGGLPLAIVVLGGLLSRKDATFTEWQKVLQSVHWQLTEGRTQCAEILALSYCDLPYCLKSCFLYFALFPEDFEVSARRLILLWVAEGFVQSRGQEPLEDVAEDYLEELIGRSMIQVASRKSNGRIKTCRIHDLLREFSISEAKEDKFIGVIHQGINDKSLRTRARRLAIHYGVSPPTEHISKVRSLLCFDLSEPIFREVKKFKLLRVLDLEGVYIAQLDSAVGNLVHLRYLGLRGTWLKRLPSSVSHLSNLQTLDLRSTLINPVPNATWKMHQLRHLYFNELRDMVRSPPANTSLANLQTLHGLCISGTSCVEKGLNNLTNLRELGLHGYFVLQEEPLGKWIFESKGLQCLKLDARTTDEAINNRGGGIPKLMTFSSHAHLCKLHLRGFMQKLIAEEDFPPNLTELSLQGSLLMEDPMEKLQKLANLRVLKLKQSSYVGKEMVCSNGGFPQLHFLKLSFLSAVDTWRIEEGAMGKLRQLEIIECKRLMIVPRGLQPVTTLQNLKLGYMPGNFEMKVQEREGENWYKIEHALPM